MNLLKTVLTSLILSILIIETSLPAKASLLSTTSTEREVIDSVMSYSSRFGGSGRTETAGIAVDAEGNTYITGKVSYEGFNAEPDFPVTSGAIQKEYGGKYDIYVAKLNSAGTDFIYSTYIGGSEYEEALDIAVDSEGNAYITGYTASPDFPTTEGAFQSTWGDKVAAAFVLKLNPTGTDIVYSTLLSGKDKDSAGANVNGVVDIGTSIAVDTEGNTFIAGYTFSQNFPVTMNTVQTVSNDNCGNMRCSEGFVTKLNRDGSELIYSTYLGGTGRDKIESLDIDGDGNVYLTGETTSANFPTTRGSFRPVYINEQPLQNASEAFVTKIDSTGSTLLYSTFLGGMIGDAGTGIAIDSNRNAYITGVTWSNNFPTTEKAFRPTYVGSSPNVFVTKVNENGSGLIYSTFIGSTYPARRVAIAIDSEGQAYITGETGSKHFPTTRKALQPTFARIMEAFVTKLNSAGTALLYSSFLGGDGIDTGIDIALGDVNEVYVTGNAGLNFPTTPGAIKITRGISNTFVSKFEINSAPAPRITGVAIKEKRLFIFGESFDGGSILIEGNPKKTTENEQSPEKELSISKKATKKIVPGQTVRLQVQNADGQISAEFTFTRPLE